MDVVIELPAVEILPQVLALAPRFALAKALDATNASGQLVVEPAQTAGTPAHKNPVTTIGKNRVTLLDVELDIAISSEMQILNH